MTEIYSNKWSAKKSANISVAILSYNRCHELRRTLTEVAKVPEFWNEIIVADNASSDGTVEMVRSEFPTVRLIETGGNYGIMGSILAYEAATGDWILSLDDDSAPALESFDSLRVNLAADGNTAAIALSVRRKKIPSISQHPLVPMSKVYGFSSSGVIFNRRALVEIGAYDRELFLFSNELHWTARALLGGWNIVKADAAFVIHRSSFTNRSNAIHAYLYTRNMLLFLLRYAPKSMIHPLATRYFQRVVAFSVLHQTVIYLKAVNSTLALHRHYPEKRRPLDEVTLARINPDWCAGFSHLG